MSTTQRARRERFAIADIGMITLCSACALFVSMHFEKLRQLALSPVSPNPPNIFPWNLVWMAVCMGGIITAGSFNIRRRFRGRRVGSFGLLALSMWAGLMLMLPLDWQGPNTESLNIGWCLEFAWPLMCCWWWLACALSGRLSKRHFSRLVPWSEQCAMFVTGLFALWGVWTVVRIYMMTLGY